jgi:hypothetical protein
VEWFVLWSLKLWPDRSLNFISAASILGLCEAVKVQFSDPYKNVGKTKVLYFLWRQNGSNDPTLGDCDYDYYFITT